MELDRNDPDLMSLLAVMRMICKERADELGYMAGAMGQIMLDRKEPSGSRK